MVESFRDDPELQGNIKLGGDTGIGQDDIELQDHSSGFRAEASPASDPTASGANEIGSTLDEPVSETIVSML